jgi:hypothetical protein
MALGLLFRSREGTGEDLNASIRSVSGTGSMSSISDVELHADSRRTASPRSLSRENKSVS